MLTVTLLECFSLHTEMILMFLVWQFIAGAILASSIP